METSSIPVRFLLIKRRLLYFWNILAKSDDELVKKVLNAQKAFPVKNDWIHQVRNDLELCEIELSDDEISNLKKVTFKKFVEEKIQQLSFSYLVSLKDKHSKSEHLKPSTDMQHYLKNVNLTIEEKKLLFRLRNRLIDVKMNYKNKYRGILDCRLCGAPEESQPHLVVCSQILSDKNIKSTLQNYTYSDTFSSNEHVQIHMIKAWKQIMNIWKINLKNAA